MIFNMVRKGTAEPYVPPTWGGGTDAEIVEALQKHYSGAVDLADYWSVGDERVVSLSAIASTNITTNGHIMSHSMTSEAHTAQNITFVLMNVGGKTLSDGVTECAFVVGQKDLLYAAGAINGERAYSYAGGWEDSCRRYWCNSLFYSAIPSTLRPIFKQHLNVSADVPYSVTQTPFTSIDYFALPAEKEVLGSCVKADPTVESSLTQFEYYETAANRIKYYTQGDGYEYQYWTRSVEKNTAAFVCGISASGESFAENAANTNCMSPFGVI